jgi:hypothetical protein
MRFFYGHERYGLHADGPRFFAPGTLTGVAIGIILVGSRYRPRDLPWGYRRRFRPSTRVSGSRQVTIERVPALRHGGLLRPALIEERPMIDNRIGGDWVAPASGCYLSLGYSVAGTGEAPTVQVARSGAEDVQRALGASHRAAGPWGAASVWGRTRLLRQMPWRLRERRLELFIGDLAERGGLDPGGCHPRGALLRLWLGALVGASATREGPGPGPAVRGASGVTTLALPAADPPSAGLGRLVCLLGGGCTVVCAVLYARRRPALRPCSALYPPAFHLARSMWSMAWASRQEPRWCRRHLPSRPADPAVTQRPHPRGGAPLASSWRDGSDQSLQALGTRSGPSAAWPALRGSK